MKFPKITDLTSDGISIAFRAENTEYDDNSREDFAKYLQNKNILASKVDSQSNSKLSLSLHKKLKPTTQKADQSGKITRNSTIFNHFQNMDAENRRSGELLERTVTKSSNNEESTSSLSGFEEVDQNSKFWNEFEQNQPFFIDRKNSIQKILKEIREKGENLSTGSILDGWLKFVVSQKKKWARKVKKENFFSDPYSQVVPYADVAKVANGVLGELGKINRKKEAFEVFQWMKVNFLPLFCISPLDFPSFLP